MKNGQSENTLSHIAETDLLHNIGSHIAQGDTLDESFAATVDATVALVQCDECFTYIRQGGQLVPWVWKYVEQQSDRRSTVAMNEGFAAALALQRVPLAAHNTAGGTSFKVFEEWSRSPGEMFTCIPFLSRSQLVGAITMQHWKPRPYSHREVRLLSTIGYLVGADIGISQMEKANAELQLELETRKLVERGKGILQRELGLSEQEAYLALERQSQHKQRPMKEIAQAIILSAEVRRSVGPME